MFGLRRKKKHPDILRFNLYQGTGDFTISILARNQIEAEKFCKQHFPYHYLKINLQIENVCIAGNILITNEK